MQTKTYQTFKFEEATPELQTLILEKNRDINTSDPYWYQVTEWGFTDQLKELGYTNIETAFSGFWSQGDGASFTANIDLMEWLSVHKKTEQYKDLVSLINEGWLYAKVERIDTHYSHENTCRAYVYQNGCHDGVSDLVEALQDELEAERKKLSIQYYEDLRNVWDSISDESAVTETLINGEYEFNEKTGEIEYQE